MLLVGDGRVVVDRRMQSIGVEPVDPAGGLGFDLVVHQTRCGEAGISTTAGEQGLLDRRHHELGRLGHRYPPPQNAPGIDIDDKRGVAEPGVRPHR